VSEKDRALKKKRCRPSGYEKGKTPSNLELKTPAKKTKPPEERYVEEKTEKTKLSG